MVLLWLIGLACLCGALGAAESEVTRSVRATGFGVILGGDLAAAREQAKQSALREAVEEAMGTLISAHTRVENFAVIEDRILTHTRGYIRRFDMVDQGSIDASTYQVVIEAVVSLGELHQQLDALALLTEAAGNPRIACAGRERLLVGGVFQEQDWGIVSGELVRVLQAANPRLEIAAPLPAPRSGIDFDGLLAAAAEHADIAVVGDAAVQPAPGIKIPFAGTTLEDAGLTTAVAELRILMVWADTREVMAELTGVRRAADSSLEAAAHKAIRQGIEELQAELIERLAEDWRDKVYSGRLIRLVVRGDRDLLDLFERGFPDALGGIDELYPRSYEPGLAIYDAQSKSAAFQAARELTAKGVRGVHTEILGISLNALDLQLSRPVDKALGR